MRLLSRRSSAPMEEVPPWPQHAEAVRLLLIDDDEDEYELLRGVLGDIRGTQYELEWVSSYGEGIQAISEGRHHAYLIDYRLGGASGVDLVRQAREKGSEDPLIRLTGEGSRSVDMTAMEAGATDFLEKGTPPALLERSIRYAITQAATSKALRRALRQISGVEAIGRLLSQDGPRPEALDQVMGLAVDEFGVDAAALYLMEEGTLQLAAVRGYDHPLGQVDPRSGRLSRVIETGRGQMLPSVSVDPHYRADAPAELVLPLMAEGACLGIMNTAYGHEGRSADDERGLRFIADRLAVSLALNRAIRGRSHIAPVRQATSSS